MPTLTLDITNGINDGDGYAGQPVVNSHQIINVTNSGQFTGHGGAWLRFTGITIPQSTVINSATLAIYACLPFIQNGTLRVYQDTRQAPGNPINGNSILNPANAIPTSMAPQVSITVTNYANPFVPGSYLQKNANVLSLVQTLVNSYDYNNGEMVFYLNGKTNVGPVAIYARDWGTGKNAELVITYTLPPPINYDKTTYNFK